MRMTLAITAALAIPLPAFSQITQGQVSGFVTRISEINGLVPPGIQLGDAVSASFSYGAVISYWDWDTQTRRYSFADGDFSFQVLIGSHTWSVVSGIGYANIENDQPVRQRDQYYISTVNISGSPATFPGALQSSYLALGIYDWTLPFQLVSGLALPRLTSDINLIAANQTQGVISTSASGFGPLPSTWTINYSVNSFSLTPIPEPTSASLLLAGAITLAGLNSRRLRRRADPHKSAS